MTEFETVNFFKDRAVQDDPYPYYDWLRAQHPVWQEPRYGVYMISGHEEAMAVYNDAVTYSSCNTIAGPFVKFSVPFEGHDVSDIIDVRPAQTHRPSRPAHAIDHAEAPERERRVHVAALRPAAR